MTLFIQMFRYAAEPFFFAQAKEGNAKEVYAAVMKYFIIFGLVIFLVVMLYIDVFKYFIGPDYWEGLRIVPIILLANLLMGVFYNLSIWYKLTDRTKFGAYIALAGAVVTITLNLILVPLYSYVGAAWSHLACYVTAVVLSYFLGQKYYRVDYNLKRIILFIAVATGLFLLTRLWDDVAVGTKLVLNSLLLLGFVGMVVSLEWKNLRSIK
jgi:O-antigen/teichoic acid export membrane protein